LNRKLMRPPVGAGGGKESFAPAAQPRKKPTPPEQTHAEEFYFVKQMQARTPVAVVLTDGEVLQGTIEWYDRDCIKLTRYGSPNLLIFKHAIKYIYKTGDEAASGGSNGQSYFGTDQPNGFSSTR
jgi:host factor-I protein